MERVSRSLCAHSCTDDSHVPAGTVFSLAIAHVEFERKLNIAQCAILDPQLGGREPSHVEQKAGEEEEN